MKKIAAMIMLMVSLWGCSGKNAELDRVLALRGKLLQANGCSFQAEITADYGKELHTFTLDCTADSKGELSFSVSKPENIAGISGKVSAEGGKLIFDDQVLAFELLADGQLSPVSSPWVFVKTLRGGYINTCGKDGDYLLATIDDSFEDDALQLDIWLEDRDIPIHAEILWSGRRILSMDIKNFRFL